MEYIPGRICSREFYRSLSKQAQENIIRNIAGQMRLLRDVPTPSPEYYGRIYHQGWHPNMLQLQYAGPRGCLRGPYDSHEDFINAVYKTQEYTNLMQYCDDFDSLAKLYFQSFPQIMSRAVGRKPVLNHLDFKMDQVMILENEDKDNPDVVILDWSYMGWVPAYMDTALSLHTGYNEYYGHIYNWEMGKDVEPAHLDTALYFQKFLQV